LFTQPGIASLIARDVSWVIVLGAVYLDAEANRSAEEIEHIWPDGMLATKTQAFEFLTS